MKKLRIVGAANFVIGLFLFIIMSLYSQNVVNSDVVIISLAAAFGFALLGYLYLNKLLNAQKAKNEIK